MSRNEADHNFSINLNPVYDRRKIQKLVRQNTPSIFEYVEHTQASLTEQLAKEFPVHSDNIYVGAGATEILFTLPMSLSKHKAIIPVPTFWEFSVANKKANKEIIYVPTTKEDGFKLNISGVLSLAGHDAAAYICNPTNPTSVLHDSEELKHLIETHTETDFVVDETYLLVRPDYEHKSLIRWVREYKNLYVVTSLSKFFLIPGLRVGLLMSDAENISRFRDAATPYLRSSFVDALVPKLLAEHEYNAAQRRDIALLTQRFSQQLQEEVGSYITVYPAAANFILLELTGASDSSIICRRLQESGYTVRDGSEFLGLGNTWLRISVKTEQQNKDFMRAFKKALAA